MNRRAVVGQYALPGIFGCGHALLAYLDEHQTEVVCCSCGELLPVPTLTEGNNA